MQGVYLRVFVAEKQKHHGQLLYEWLLQEARALGLPGGSAFLAVAGYGRHGLLHDAGFFELAGELPVAVDFLADEAAIERLLARVAGEGLRLPYLKLAAAGGVTGAG